MMTMEMILQSAMKMTTKTTISQSLVKVMTKETILQSTVKTIPKKTMLQSTMMMPAKKICLIEGGDKQIMSQSTLKILSRYLTMMGLISRTTRMSTIFCSKRWRSGSLWSTYSYVRRPQSKIMILKRGCSALEVMGLGSYPRSIGGKRTAGSIDHLWTNWAIYPMMLWWITLISRSSTVTRVNGNDENTRLIVILYLINTAIRN